MSDFRYTCPSCNTTLKTAAAIPEGKAIKCPKCQTVFKPGATAPAAPPPPSKAAVAPAPKAPPPTAPTPRAPARPTPPAAKPTATTATPKASAAASSEPGVVDLGDHKGEITLPRDWKKKKPKSGGNGPILIGLGCAVLAFVVVCGGCCILPAMLGPSESTFVTKGAPTFPFDKNFDKGGDKSVEPLKLSKESLAGTWEVINESNGMRWEVTYTLDGKVDWKEAPRPRKGTFEITDQKRFRMTWDDKTPPPSYLDIGVSEFSEEMFKGNGGTNRKYRFTRK